MCILLVGGFTSGIFSSERKNKGDVTAKKFHEVCHPMVSSLSFLCCNYVSSLSFLCGSDGNLHEKAKTSQ